MSALDLPPAPATSLADEIAYRLERDILEGRIGLGERLGQDELCARFGVSRTPVREALTKLEASSLVTLRRNRGAVVRTPARREVQEVYELRAELEGFAAERACSRIDGVGLRRLGYAQQELAAAVEGVDPGQFEATGRSELAAALGGANDAFHDVILEAADNEALTADVRRLRGCFPKDYVTEAVSSVNELLTLNVAEHDAIQSALTAGDAAAARRAMTDHIAYAGHLLIEHLDRQRFWGMSAADLPVNAAVLGAGTIGLATGLQLAAHGVPVTLVTRRAEAADQMPEAIARRLERLTALGALSATQVEAARTGIRASVGLPEGESFELIYESVGEQLADKRSVLAAAERSLAGGGVIVSGTSSLPVAELASSLNAPQRFAAWHWFHPADLIPLVEVVPGERTANEVVEALRRWSSALGKRAIVLRTETPGFVANRLQYALLREGYALVEAGVCSREDIDLAVTAGLGARWAAIGPFASMDLAGLEVHANVARALFAELSNATDVPDSLAQLRAEGVGGAREGQGLLGEYSPARLAALEDRRDRCLVQLQGDRDGR